jgi:hypothetical protein
MGAFCLLGTLFFKEKNMRNRLKAVRKQQSLSGY